MKTLIAIILLLAVIAVSFASITFPPYDKSKPPTLSLPIAYERAVAALGVETNQFHCISAVVTTSFSSDGEWYFTFHSTKTDLIPKFIAVKFNGKVIFDNGLR